MSHAVRNQISVLPYCRAWLTCRDKTCHSALKDMPGKPMLNECGRHNALLVPAVGTFPAATGGCHVHE
jgi:hypothetical protein